MGLIDRFLAPWRAAAAQEEMNSGLLAVMREIIRVAAAQTEANHQMQQTLAQISAMFLTTGAPESWTNDEEAKLMADFMTRLSADEPHRQDN